MTCAILIRVLTSVLGCATTFGEELVARIGSTIGSIWLTAVLGRGGRAEVCQAFRCRPNADDVDEPDELAAMARGDAGGASS